MGVILNTQPSPQTAPRLKRKEQMLALFANREGFTRVGRRTSPTARERAASPCRVTDYGAPRSDAVRPWASDTLDFSRFPHATLCSPRALRAFSLGKRTSLHP